MAADKLDLAGRVARRNWVQGQFEVAIPWDKWTAADYEDFIEDYYEGGLKAFNANH